MTKLQMLNTYRGFLEPYDLTRIPRKSLEFQETVDVNPKDMPHAIEVRAVRQYGHDIRWAYAVKPGNVLNRRRIVVFRNANNH